MLKTRVLKYIKSLFIGLAVLLLTIICLGYSNIGELDENSKHQFLTIGKEKIRYYQQGKGKDILLIHGTPGSIEDWKFIMDSLSQNYRVTAFDRLGHGFSSVNHYNYNIKDNTVLVEKLMNELNITSPLIVGHSYGGSISAYLAVNSNIKNAQYIIIDSPLYNYQPNPLYQVIASPILGKGLATVSSLTISKKFIQKSLASMLEHLPEAQSNKIIEERQTIWNQPKVIYSKSKESSNYGEDLDLISKRYSTIDTSITLITGKDANTTFREDCERFHNEVKNTKLILLDNVKHYITVEKPNAVITVVEDMML